MSTTSTDLMFDEGAQPLSDESAFDLAQYTLQQVRRDAEFVLLRGRAGSGPPILVQAPVADPPSPATLRKIQHEYSLRSELDPGYVVRPLAHVQTERRPMLILQDPGGTPLDLLLSGAMEITEFLALAVSIAAAVGHVHGNGLVHKDINPANILVNTARDQAWLMGLGVASRLPRERQPGQLSEFLVGTMAYMAPEQTGRMNRSIDSRSDLYSLGITFYEMLAGTLPFTASDPMEWVHCHIARQPTPPCEKGNSVPRAISAIIMKLLAKTAEERYQTAAGLESDLRRCLTEWESQHRIDEFPLGEHDTPDRLLIPEKLYGRESEIDALLAAFDRVVAGGKPELVLVSGYSGIGKSSVVNELHKSVPPWGLFASGKFDQYKRDIPYATLAQAFQSLVQRLLGKSEADLVSWRDALRDALGPNGRLIIELVPELELIIGRQPPPPDLPPHDARRRFQLSFRRFIGVFARPEHPLVLFLDDLQWLDAATLDLLEDLLTGSDLQHLMLIGAYRTNELTSAHALKKKLEAITAADGKVLEIMLAPLTPEHLQQLISETLRCEAEHTAPLAQLVHEKTGGNPFFANRFIASLAEEGLLTFDHDAARWSWDLGRIHAKRYTDNLVDLMAGKLTRLTAATQNAVQHLACLGSGAAVGTLSLIYGTTEAEIHSLLDEAVRAELLERRKDSYHFIHDRVQEAAYLLVPESKRPEAHLRIGRLLAANTPPEEAIYEIVNQLNRGASLITSDAEREQLAELNLIAGKRAKAATAYGSALNYLVMGAALLSDDRWADDRWERRYPLVFAIELNRAECEFLTGDLAAAEERLSTLSVRAANLVDKAAVACLRTTLYTTLDRADRAVEICVEYLCEAGIACSPHPTDEEIREEYERLLTRLGGRPIEALFDLPLMSDRDCRATMEVLTELSAPAYLVDMNLWGLVLLRMANLSAEHGNCDGSCYAYGFLNTVVGPRFGNYRAGLHFGQLSLDLVEKKGLDRFKARVYFACGCAVVQWGQPVRAGALLLRRGLQTALETGDQTHAAYVHCNLVWNRLTSADPLAEVQREAESALKFAQKIRFGLIVDILTGQLGFIRTVRGLTPEFGSFCDDELDEDRFEQHLEASLPFVACWYWVRKLQARFYAGDYAQAVAAAANARPLLQATSGLLEEADYHFYAALARAAASDSATPDERREHSGALAEHHERLSLWAENSSDTFANRAALVGAEIARLDGRELEAERLYEQAIRAAREQGFVQNEGLAYELAARFYATRGFEAFADLYLRKARDCYQRWGADGKVRQLLELYPRLRENEPAPESRGTSSAPVEQLELATVLKVSQAVSGEMILDRLLDKLMRAAIEHAGAERGLLIARRGGELQIQAQATASGADVTVNLRDSDHTALPQSLVRYVMRTQDTVILDDASSQNLFSADPYLVQHRARSILCLPLINQSNLIGVLYLENNLAPRVFGPARIAVLKLLASQAAMSLENTRLYRDLAQREAKIRRLVDANIVGIVIWDLDGTILEANDAFLHMVGYEREDLVSGRLRWTDLSPAQWLGRDRQELVAEIQRSGSFQPIEWDYIRKDGSRVPALVGSASFEGENQGVAFVLDLTERKRVEQALRQSEAYLAEAQRLTHTGSWAFNLVTGKHTYYSDETFRLFGLDPQRGGPPEFEEIRQLIHPEERDRVLEELAQVLRDKAEYKQDYRIVLPDGTVRHMHSIGHPVLDQTGERVEYFGTVLDVTERKCAEQRLIAQHRVARILAEAATVEEATPKILQAMCECLGWEVGVRWRIDREVGALRCATVWRKPSVEAALFEAATWASTFRLGSGLPGRVWESHTAAVIPDVVQDPEVYADVAARAGLRAAFALPILLGCEVLGVIGFFSRDVWQPDQNLLDMMATIGSQIGQFMKRAATVDELQLRVSMLQQIPVAAWSGKPDGTPDLVNQLWYEYTGQTPEYVSSHPEAWMATLHPEDRERAAGIYWDGIRSGRGFTMEARFLRARDGAYRWHLNRCVPVRDSDGNILRFVGTSTDVHDWRQAQEEVRNTQAELAHMTRVLTMGELTASIAHEVNQPLGAIVTSAAACERWLAAEPPQMEKARRALQRIVNDGRRAGEVIKRIRALMKRQAPRKDWLEINDAILEVIGIVQHQLSRNDIQLETQLVDGLPLVRCDRVQLQQVLINLIVNAIEAMSGIDDRRRELTIVSAGDGPEAVAVEVRDSGMGLDPERAAHLFEPFYTTKAEGLGIGLSISRSIVEAHGGRLSAAANMPRGAVFRIALPVNEPLP